VKVLVLIAVAIPAVLLVLAARRWSTRMLRSGRVLPLPARLVGCLGFVAIGVVVVIWPHALATPHDPASVWPIIGWASIAAFGYFFVAQALKASSSLIGGRSQPNAPTTRFVSSGSAGQDAAFKALGDPSDPISSLRTAAFRLSHRGYDVASVDAYLEGIADSLEGRAGAPPMPTPEGIQQHTFQLARRGYRMSDVDGYLQAVAEELRSLPYTWPPRSRPDRGAR
jgi:DivIVA domain-containing protein